MFRETKSFTIFAQTEKLNGMEIRTIAGNDYRDVVSKANAEGIKKEDIVNIMQSKDGIFLMTYFVEE